MFLSKRQRVELLETGPFILGGPLHSYNNYLLKVPSSWCGHCKV